MQQGIVGFIGAGNMARALAGGLLASGVEPSRVLMSDTDPARREAARADFGVEVTADNTVVASRASLLVLAVKPDVVSTVVAGLAPALSVTKPTIVSVAAGVPVESIARAAGGYRRIVRCMPNRPALVRKGVSALYAPPALPAEARAAAEWLMGAVGVTLWVDGEEQLDAVTAVSGSGPAYFFLLMELLEQAAREQGLPAEAARTLAIETAWGAASMAHEGVATPAVLREQVTSPGGTTEAALRVLEQADLRGIVSRAVAAARRRAAELGAAPQR